MKREDAVAISKPLWISDMFATMVQGETSVTVRLYITPQTADKPPFEVGDMVCSKERWRMQNDKLVYYADSTTYMRHKGIWRGADSLPPSAVRAFFKVAAVERCHLKDDITFDECVITWGWNRDAVATCGIEEMYKMGWNDRLKGRALEQYGFDANPPVWKITLTPIVVTDNQLADDKTTEQLTYYEYKLIECCLVASIGGCERQIQDLNAKTSKTDLEQEQLASWKKNKDDYTNLLKKLQRIERNL